MLHPLQCTFPPLHAPYPSPNLLFHLPNHSYLPKPINSPEKPHSFSVSLACRTCSASSNSSFWPPRRSIQKWASGFFEDGWRMLNGGGEEVEFLQGGGGIGMALLSTTTMAKVRLSPFLATLSGNPTFVSGLLAWVLAQFIKFLLHFFVERKWDLAILVSSGGMPSSHSALCTALTTSVALCHGVADSLFPVCLGFSLIVMYDATGVRRHAGMQAEVLNVIIEDLFQGHPISQRKLKELLGHTPSQVIAGALLGILVACFCCQGCLLAV